MRAAVPNLGQRDRGVGMPLRDLAVGGPGTHRDSSSIDLAGKDADIVVMEECETAVDAVIETTQSVSQDAKPRWKVERLMDHSSLVERQADRNSLVGRTSVHRCRLHMARQAVPDMEEVHLL